MNDFLENNWERLTSLWRRPEEGELSQEEKKILQQQFEIRQAMHGLGSHRYDVDNAWRKIQCFSAGEKHEIVPSSLLFLSSNQK